MKLFKLKRNSKHHFNWRRRRNRGFTLVEMVIAVFIFSIIVGAASSIFVYSMRNQRKALAYQELLDQTSRVIEYMSRAIRVAQKDTAGTCVTNQYDNYSPNSGTSGNITFLRYNTEAQEYRCHRFLVENNQIKEQRCPDTAACFSSVPKIEITSSKLKVNQLVFNIIGGAQPPSDTLQPRVVISIDLENTEGGIGTSPQMQIQTTVSQRDLDIEIQI